MNLDNDLLTLWLNALVLDEEQIRGLIEELQGARDLNASDEAKADEELRREVREARAALETLRERIADIIEELPA